MSTMTYYRPVGSAELSRIEASGWSRFPERLLGMPTFWAEGNLGDAEELAEPWIGYDPLEPEYIPRNHALVVDEWETWNNDDRVGFVVSFVLPLSFVRQRGWQNKLPSSPAKDLGDLNDALIGGIELVKTIRRSSAS